MNVFQATDGKSAQVEPLTDPTVDKPAIDPADQAEIRALIAEAEALLARLRARVT